ncbi:MAG: hypothetical protein IKX20_09765 [Paludibacteraceae bacterium]|nr:hypothetical protein [Paludibacteraceae bacterium]
MMGIVLLVIPLGFLVVGIVYFSASLGKLKKTVYARSSQETVAILKKEDMASVSRIAVLGKEIEALNTKLLSDKDIELLLYGVYIKSHDKVVEMHNHNIEVQLREDKVRMPDWVFLKTSVSTINQVALIKSIRDQKIKEEPLWAQN